MSETTTYSVRPVTEDDLSRILEIEKKSYPMPWTRQQFLDELSNKRSQFLAFTDDETDTDVAGYIVFHDLEDETHILNVAIEFKWRGLGMGRRLVSYAINHAHRRNQRRVFLEVRSNNDGAIALYKSAGFEITHVRKSFYEDGTDALFMELTIKEGAEPVLN